jgi:excisionase family DNA binding protein
MFKLKDIMEMFDIPERTIRRHISMKVLNGTKVGGQWRFTEEDIKEYLDKPTMKKFIEKTNMHHLFDFINGFNVQEDTVLVMMHKNNNNVKTNAFLTNYVTNFKGPYKFHIGKSSQGSLITFIGSKDNGIDLIKYIDQLK